MENFPATLGASVVMHVFSQCPWIKATTSFGYRDKSTLECSNQPTTSRHRHRDRDRSRETEAETERERERESERETCELAPRSQSNHCYRLAQQRERERDTQTQTQRDRDRGLHARSSMSAVSTIGVTAFSLAGRELAKVFVPRDVSVRMLVEALGATAGISWDAWQLTWKGEALEDWSIQPFIASDSELSSVELQAVLKPQPMQLDPEHEHAVELLEALKEPYDGLRGLSFALGSLRQLSLGAKDDDRCFKDCRGDDSSGVMSEPQMNALLRAVLDNRLQCTVLCLRGVLRPMGMMARAVDRQDSADLISLLSHMPQLTSLDLSGNRLGYTNTCIEALGTAMPKLQKLTYLNLSCNGFFSFHGGSGMLPPHVSALFVSLLTLTALEVLDLSLNDKAFVRDFCKEKEELGSSYVPRLLKELSLKKLLFAGNDAGLSTVAALEASRQPGCEIDYGLGDHVAEALRAIQEPAASTAQNMQNHSRQLMSLQGLWMGGCRVLWCIF